MTDFATLLTEPTPRAARAVALALLDAVEAGRARLDDARDAEALHDFRVALRRLRSWLRAYRDDLDESVGKRVRRTLGDIGRSTSDARDIEVHLEWIVAQKRTLTPPGRAAAVAMERRLRADQMRATAAFHAVLTDGFATASARLRKRLSRYPVAVWDHEPGDRWAVTAAARIQEGFDEFRTAIAAVEDADDDAAAHAARIAAKRLRYLVEPLAGATDGAAESVALLKVVQDSLGALHDAHVFARTLRRQSRGAHGKRTARGAAEGYRLLVARLRRRRTAAWKAYAESWLDTDFPRLTEQVRTVVRTLRDIGGAGVEIERKYLLRKLPREVKGAPVAEIDQGYLPGTALVERIRRSATKDGVRYLRTVKSGQGIARIEIEEACDETIFNALWPLTEGRRVRKRRYRVADAGRVWEIDAFTDRRLVLAEVELSSTRDEVTLPDWLQVCTIREVTEEAEYVNLNLAK
jgi:CHAD domain-containing protein/CYTH domain-containing protein